MAIISTNPATGQVLKEFKENSKEEILEAVKRAKIAQKQWFSKTKQERIEIMQKVKENFLKHKDELVDLINKECGFDKGENEGSFFDVIDGFDYYTEEYAKQNNIDFEINREVFPESDCKIKFYPLGVVAQIGIWNYPFWQTMSTAIPALVSGNAIVYKPSEYSTQVGLKIAEIFNSAQGFPKDIFIPIIGGPEEGKILVKSEVDAIVYTGNPKTGKNIIENAGIKPLVLELSGNDAAIVLEDCNLEQAVDGIASGAFLHSGEVCDRIKRVYAVEKIADEFIKGIVEKTNSIDEKITPLISEKALEKVEGQIKRTVEQGGNILFGGFRKQKPGFYYCPTIIQVQDNKAESMQNEVFGPVVTLMVVKDENEAIQKANDSEYGLGASVWTQDFEKGKKIADKFESGMVWVNDSNIPLVCGEYFQGWKQTSTPNAMNRLKMFQKKKTVICFNSDKKRDWWF